MAAVPEHEDIETLVPAEVSGDGIDPFGATGLPLSYDSSDVHLKSAPSSLPFAVSEPTTVPGRTVERHHDVQAAGAAPSVPLLPTVSVNRYTDARRLGEGGMGTVELVRDAVVGRDVAIKRLRVDYNHRADLRLRFLREARVQGQLEHPAIVPVYDVSAAEDGTPFFSMKRVRGETLEDLLQQRRQSHKKGANQDPTSLTQSFLQGGVRTHSLRKVLSALAQVALAVDFAHSRGVVHRDLKPANIMLGAWGEVYVLDWGIAKLRTDADELPESTVTPDIGVPNAFATALGSITGTVGYLSPEQARGLPADARADVWALGAILFEIIVGEPLVASGSAAKMLAETVRGPDLTRLAHDRSIAVELADLCVTALDGDLEKRLHTARAFHDRLEQFLDGERDAKRRQEAALEEAQRATVALQAGDRDGAVAAAQSALAFDPSCVEARALLVDALTAAPVSVTEKMSEEIDEEHQRDYVKLAKLGAIAYGCWLFAIPMFMYAGVRSWPLVFLYAAAMLVSSGYSAYLATQKRISPTEGVLLLSAVLFGLGVLAFFVGPLLFIPGIAAVNSVIFASGVPARLRRFVVALSSLSVVLPFLLEVAGLVGPSFRFEGGTLQLLPRIVELSPRIMPLILSFGLLQFWVMNFFVLRMRRDMELLEYRLLAHAEDLRRFVPAGAKDAAKIRRTRPLPRADGSGSCLSATTREG